MKKRAKTLTAFAAVVGALAVPAVASAQAPVTGAPVTGYGGVGGQVAGQVPPGGGTQGAQGNGRSGVAAATDSGGRSAAAEATSSHGLLPFTGLDLVFLVGGGLLLIGTGVALSRLVSRTPA